jgi:hypothetical protein
MKKNTKTLEATGSDADVSSNASRNWYELAYERFSISRRMGSEIDDGFQPRILKRPSEVISDVGEGRRRR